MASIPIYAVKKNRLKDLEKILHMLCEYYEELKSDLDLEYVIRKYQLSQAGVNKIICDRKTIVANYRGCDFWILIDIVGVHAEIVSPDEFHVYVLSISGKAKDDLGTRLCDECTYFREVLISEEY